ncbi:MAG TPA: hypothetical protein VGL96_01450, partial [Casimicrobiaceae bacterium]
MQSRVVSGALRHAPVGARPAAHASTPASSRRRVLDWSAPLSAAIVVLLALLVLLPLFWLAVTSVQDDAKQWTLANYRQLVADP